MNIFNITFILILTLSNSCQSQNKSILLDYKAQTRGFLYQIKLENNSLEINSNNSIKIILLTKNQIIKVENFLNKISFKEIETNISTNDLAVDRAIKGVFNLNYSQNKYHFDFNHNNLPTEIEGLMKLLESFTN